MRPFSSHFLNIDLKYAGDFRFLVVAGLYHTAGPKKPWRKAKMRKEKRPMEGAAT